MESRLSVSAKVSDAAMTDAARSQAQPASRYMCLISDENGVPISLRLFHSAEYFRHKPFVTG